MKRKKTTALTIAAFCLALTHMAGNAASAKPLDLSVIAGQWARIDGSYTLRVEDVMSDGTAEVSYFNPRRIHVAESRISTRDGRIKLFVKLRDEDYPGCTYTLFYYHEQDVLAGVYYQAAVGRTYEVIFVRKDSGQMRFRWLMTYYDRMNVGSVLCIVCIAMLLVFCMKQATMPPGANAATLEDIQRYLTEVGGSPVSPMAGDRQPHMLLDPEEKQVTGFAGCNHFFGSYELEGSSLTFGPMGATRMACPDLETGLETSVFEALERTRKWKQADEELLLLDADEVLARFSQEKYMPLVGPVWQWTQTLYNDDRKVVPENPENYTVQFQKDGAISVKADCNRKGGTYSISNGVKRISIEITQSTMAACPEGSLEDEFVKGLSAAAIYFIQNGDLYIDLKYDTGTMRFSKQNES